MDLGESLHQYYGHLRNEVTRYRNLEWQITAYVAGVLVFLFSILGDTSLFGTGGGLIAKALWTALITLIGGFGVFALIYVHRALNRARDDLVRLEVRMGYHDPLAADQRLVDLGYHRPGETQTVAARTPRRYRGFSEGVGVVFVFAFTVFIAIFSGMSVARAWLEW